MCRRSVGLGEEGYAQAALGRVFCGTRRKIHSHVPDLALGHRTPLDIEVTAARGASLATGIGDGVAGCLKNLAKAL